MSAARLGAWVVVAVAAAAPWAFGAEEPSWEALVAAACLAAGALALVATPPGTFRQGAPRSTRIALAAVVAVAAGALIPLPEALRALLAPAGTALLRETLPADASSWRPASLAPQATVGALALAAAYALVFVLVAAEAARRGGRTVVTGTLAATGAGLAVLGVLQHVTQPGVQQPLIYWTYPVYEAGTPFGPYVNRNHFAGAMAILASVAAGEALAHWAERRRAAAGAYGAAALAMLGALATTQSRGGALAAASAGAFLLVSAPRGRRARGVLVGLAAVAAVGVVLLWTGALDGFLDRMTSLAGRWRSRFAVQRDALAAFAGNPVWGTGAGTFEDVFPAFQSGGDDRTFQNAHSDWAQLAMETGLVGLAAVSLAGRELLRWVRSGLRRTGADRWRVLGPCAAATAVVVHGLVEVNLHVPANALLTVCALSLASAAAGAPDAPPRAAGPAPDAPAAA